MEFLDTVDESDEVIGKLPRKEIYEKLLPHRIVHVLVFNSEGDVALQMRSDKAGFCPLHWCTTAGGHVMAGESYEEAALRELEEETGQSLPIQFAYKDVYVHTARSGGALKKFLAMFTARYDGPFIVGKEEVEKIEFFTLDEIQNMINIGEKFHPELLFLLRKHYGLR